MGLFFSKSNKQKDKSGTNANKYHYTSARESNLLTSDNQQIEPRRTIFEQWA